MKALESHARIQEILRKTDGQTKLTEQAIRQLITRDHDFLQGLVDPYISGIIAHAIERARKTPAVKRQTPRETSYTTNKEPVREPLPKKIVKARNTKTLGNDQLSGVLDALADQFAQDQNHKKPAKASDAHIKTMQSLAKKSFGKKSD
jgi:hypothetical protein